ncbi:MAG: hypothetical protein HDQ87_08675 [Clostridia bacterium]|nr:hypothetical protein [Clostridia bacterium]
MKNKFMNGIADEIWASLSARDASEWDLRCPPRFITGDMIEGTFEAFGDAGVLHLGVTFPSSGCERAEVYVDPWMVNGFGLRPGDRVQGEADQTGGGMPKLQTVEAVNGLRPDRAWQRPDFSRLVPVYPDEQLLLSVTGPDEAVDGESTMRDIDAYAPIGKGTRALVIAPAAADRACLLAHMAASIETNNPEVELFVLLLGGRNFDPACMSAAASGGEVICLDRFESPSRHVRAAALTIERAKRLVELGADVAVLMDGITLLSDSCARVCGDRRAAIYESRLLFGAARNIENGGSLTIIATAFEERKDIISIMTDVSTASIRLTHSRLDNEFPGIDSKRSWCRRDDLFHRGRGL